MTEKCENCDSKRIMSVSGKCSDMFSAQYKEMGYEGYVLANLNISDNEDYIDFDFCLNCGKIQGEFPVEVPLELLEEEE